MALCIFAINRKVRKDSAQSSQREQYQSFDLAGFTPACNVGRQTLAFFAVKKYFEPDDKVAILFEYLKELEQTKQEETDFKQRKRIGFKST